MSIKILKVLVSSFFYSNKNQIEFFLDRSQSSYSAPSSSEPSTFNSTPKMLTRNKCLPSTTFHHHPQSVKLLSTNGIDNETNFYASTDIMSVNNNDLSSTLRGVCGTSLMARAITNTPQMIVPPRKVELISSEIVPPGDLYGEGRFGQVWKEKKKIFVFFKFEF